MARYFFRGTFFLLAMIVLGCAGDVPVDDTPVEVVDQTVDESDLLPFALSEGQPDDVEDVRPPLAATRVLSQEQLQMLLSRLPALQVEEGDVQEYRLPAQSLPPPRPGQEVTLPFPQPQEVAVPEVEVDNPLEVLRFAPEGAVPLAPQLSVTFNQPMVPLSSHDELAQEDIPLKLWPDVRGNWRWVGTKTLFFEAQVAGIDRMPMATQYTAEIPAGTAAVNGQELAETVSWTFHTPAVTLQRGYPSGGTFGLEPVFFSSFDQRIDPVAVLQKIQVTARGRTYPVRLASADERAKVQHLIEGEQESRWLAFVSDEPFPKDSTVTVTFVEGTPSAEGPLVTEQPQSYSFQTYGPFMLRHAECAWDGGRECYPFTPWSLIFSNPIDSGSFDSTLISIEPKLEGVQFDIFGNTLQIRGNTQGRTTYTVTVAADLTDVFGQTLAEDVEAQFRIRPMETYLTANSGPLTVLDPYSEPTFPIYTVNINAVTVRAYRVEPEQYVDYLQWQPYYSDARSDPPGTLVLERVVNISGQGDVMTETSINLADALDGPTGHLILEVRPASGLFSDLFNRRDRDMSVISWIQVTHIGLDAFVDADEMLVWANRLQDGAPLPSLQVSLWPQDIAGITDETGTVRLSLPADGAQLLIARDGEDVVFLPEDQYNLDYSAWKLQTAEVAARFYVFDDRQMYRPGETVNIKGWVRQIQPGPEGDVGLFSERMAGQDVNYRVSDSLGNTITRGTTALNALGGFDFHFDLPLNVNLGFTRIELQPFIFGLYGDNRPRHVHTIQVQEFRRPEFDVSTAVSEGPHLVGGHALATVSASYFAGGPLPGAEVEWYVNARSGSYSPPNWSGFTFGKWIPWWSFYDGYDDTDLGSASFNSRTDSAGEHTLRIDFQAGASRYPLQMETNATVFDVNRQAWTNHASLLVHPADLYIGLRSERYFVEKDEPLSIDLVVTDINGKAIEGHRASLRAARLDWRYRNDKWQEVEEDVQECMVETTSANNPYAGGFATCTFETPHGGQYRITATVMDSQGRANETVLVRWVSGGQYVPSRNVEQEEIQLIPDRESYQPGDSAEILVQAAFFPAEGIVTLRREGLISSERFSMEGPTHTLRLPIEDRYIPNLHVQVDLVGAAPRVDEAGNELSSLPPRPAYARGSLNLSIPPLRRILQVEATPREDRLEPGGETTIDVTVRDATGEPVADAEFALVVVDEAILALTGYQLVDPIDIFYSGRASDVNEYHNRAHILLADPDLLAVSQDMPQETSPQSLRVYSSDMARVESAPMAMEEAAMDMDSAEAGVGGGSGEGQAIRVRLNFDPLALFAPEVRTDAQGQASVSVTVPDNLTRYRIMLVAVAGGKFFGLAESSLTARLPLMVRPSAPRFLNFGDDFELPVVLQNQTDEPMDVYVAGQGTNIASSQANANKASWATGYALTVPAADRVEVRFPARTVRAGSARFQFMATDVKRSAIADAATIELPVFTPATTEAFAVYGELDTNTAILQAVRPPDEVIPSYGGLEVTLSSTALQTLTDAFLYLLRYPYDCSEQIASRILGVVALRDVLSAFDAEELPDPEEIERSMEQDIQALQSMQDYRGGFPIWRRGDRIWPYYSVHVAHALARAQQKGYQVPEDMISRSLAYLRSIQYNIPEWYDVQTRRALVSYALYVRKLLHDHDPARARMLIMEAGLENLSLESIGWLLFVLTDDPASAGSVQEIRRFLQNRVTETAGAATISSGYSDGEYLLLYSSRRADAVLLEALMVDQPQSDLITKLVRGLLGHRTKGRWGNTQENVWVLLAMERFFNTFEAQTPDFMARIWLGDQYAAGHQFQGRSVQNVTLDLPMQFVQDRPTDDDGTVPLVVQKEGAGRLYYRLGLRYAPTDLQLAALDNGFVVERVYEAMDDPDDVSRDAKGTWHIRAGARVRVKLTMVVPARRVHVALVDPLPAGLEILNPALAVSGELPEDPPISPRRFSRYWWWERTWYEHQNLRDMRAEAFSSFLGAGVYQYSYTARATTPGTFVVPPAKAEEMYAPETFGRSGTDWVVVEAREE